MFLEIWSLAFHIFANPKEANLAPLRSATVLRPTGVPAVGMTLDGSVLCWRYTASITSEYIFRLEICSIKNGMKILPLGYKDAWGWDNLLRKNNYFSLFQPWIHRRGKGVAVFSRSGSWTPPDSSTLLGFMCAFLPGRKERRVSMTSDVCYETPFLTSYFNINREALSVFMHVLFIAGLGVRIIWDSSI